MSRNGPRDGFDRSGAEGEHNYGRAAEARVRRRPPDRQHRTAQPPQGKEPEHQPVRHVTYILMHIIHYNIFMYR